jgi:hypothetical protein
MQYFILRAASDTPETGPEYPQIQKMNVGYNYKADNSVYAISRLYKSFPEYVPNLDHFVLHNKAKLTDLLSVSVISGGFLISNKLKEIIDQFTIVPHKFYPAKVMHKKSMHDNYFWMHIVSDMTDCINYGNTKFFIYYNYGHKLGNIEISSKDEYNEMRTKIKQDNPEKNITIWADKIYLSDSFNRNLDLFKISTFNSDYFISKNLKDKIVEKKITGCDITVSEIFSL